ncbi:MAG: hypothetical protein ACXWT3_11535, partial [Methylococcaceae bacterium]
MIYFPARPGKTLFYLEHLLCTSFNSFGHKKREGIFPPFSGFAKCLSLELETDRTAQCEAVSINAV